MTGFFNADVARSYDERNARLAPVAGNLHFLLRILLKDLPPQARVLCVGVGTGAEILSLAGEYPGWSFVGVDPSAPMLDACRARLADAGVSGRCRLVHGRVADVPAGEGFDAVVSLLVGHFVPRGERPDFYRGMQARLVRGGCLVNAEISFDTGSPAFPSMLAQWARLQFPGQDDPGRIAALATQLRETLCVLPPEEVEELIRGGGAGMPVRFFQSLMIAGWYSRKE